MTFAGKELFIRFTASAFRKLLSIYVFNCFPFGFEGKMWDLIVSVSGHCLFFYFKSCSPCTSYIMCRMYKFWAVFFWNFLKNLLAQNCL